VNFQSHLQISFDLNNERLGKAERDLAERRVGRPAIRDDRRRLQAARPQCPDHDDVAPGPGAGKRMEGAGEDDNNWLERERQNFKGKLLPARSFLYFIHSDEAEDHEIIRLRARKPFHPSSPPFKMALASP
jgi:hypothetical protein